MSTAIVIDSIVKAYGSAPPVVAGVSLRINAGELFFLLGPSGCGKTTLLRMIAGFTEPTSGRILFEVGDAGGSGGAAGVKTVDVTGMPPNKRNTGMVFQSYALWPHMTVAQNVAFGLSVRRVGREETESRVREALDLVQMGSFAQRKPNQLSGGQQQRVALARALVVRPDVLLLDEPLSNLDAKLRVELRSEIRRICKSARGGGRAGGGGSAMTAVYVTHDQKEALSMADRVAVMHKGGIEQLGPPAELYHTPRTRFVAEFLGETNFIETVAGEGGSGRASGDVVVTAYGRLMPAHWPSGAVGRAGGRPVVSIRPEALRVGPVTAGGATNTLRGTIVDTAYLGDMAQHVVELEAESGSGAGGGGARGGMGGQAAQRVKVAVMNPGGASASVGQEVGLSVEPRDVVLVADE